MMNYNEAVKLVGKKLALQYYQQHMSGRMFARYDNLTGSVQALSIVYGVSPEEVEKSLMHYCEYYKKNESELLSK